MRLAMARGNAEQAKVFLSIDFDFWARHDVPAHDWGQGEAPFLINGVWVLRASDALRDGGIRRMCWLPDDEPRPRDLLKFLSREKGWTWRRHGFDAYVAESHAYAWKHVPNGATVVNIDAHCDFGYDAGGPVDCANWLGRAIDDGRVANVVQVYPTWNSFDWREDFEFKASRWRRRGVGVTVVRGLENIPKGLHVPKVFLCRSGAWSPPWLDFYFAQLAVRIIGHCRGCRMYGFRDTQSFRREFDWRAARELADAQKAWLAGMVGVA